MVVINAIELPMTWKHHKAQNHQYKKLVLFKKKQNMNLFILPKETIPRYAETACCTLIMNYYETWFR